MGKRRVLSLFSGAGGLDLARGVDVVAGELARVCPGWAEVPMDADWETVGRGAGAAGNARMASVAEEMVACGWRMVVLAMPAARSRGTLDMMRRAKAAGFTLFERGLADEECRPPLGLSRGEAELAVRGIMRMGQWPPS